jgi:hypothetical protein
MSKSQIKSKTNNTHWQPPQFCWGDYQSLTVPEANKYLRLGKGDR